MKVNPTMRYPSILALAMMALVTSSDAQQHRRLFNWDDLKALMADTWQNKKTTTSVQPISQDLCNDNGNRDLVSLPVFQFTTNFFVIMGGPTDVFQGEEITTVQAVMRDSYNDAGSCSSGLVLDSVIITGQELVGASGGDRRLAKSFSLVNRYAVKGRCRFCKNNVKLFNDAVRRRLEGVAINTFNSASLVNLQSAGFDEITSVEAADGSPPTKSPTTQPQPTARPTAVPTKKPTREPTLSPTLRRFCDDSRDTQFEVEVVNNLFGTTEKQMQTCIWLTSRKIEQVTYCDPQHPQRAYYICPETCRACHDSCTEDPVAFFAYQGGERTCLWLSIRPDVQDVECLPGRSAYSICTETCNSCQDGAGLSLPIPPHQICDDSRDALIFIDDANGMQSCEWLKNSQSFRDVLCAPKHSSRAYDTCEETCGKCKDTCEDSKGTFVDDNNQEQNCQWLSSQKDKLRSYCASRSMAFYLCPETCGACDL